jgi:hypothetical protein
VNEGDHVLMHLKSNVSAKAPALRHQIAARLLQEGLETSRILFGYEDPSLSADDLADYAKGSRADRSDRDEVKDWLWDYLGETGQRKTTVVKEAKAAGFSDITLRRAKADLRIEAVHIGGRTGFWVWRRPQGSHTIPGERLYSDSQKKFNNNNNIYKDVKDAHAHIYRDGEHLSPDNQKGGARADDEAPQAPTENLEGEAALFFCPVEPGGDEGKSEEG